jgi:hypothetical protein
MRRLLASLSAAHVEVLHRAAEAMLMLDWTPGKSVRGPNVLLPLVFQLSKSFMGQYEALAADLCAGLRQKEEVGLAGEVIGRLVKETYQEASPPVPIVD